MNSLKSVLVLGLFFYFGITTLNAQNVIIPDANFKAYLVGNVTINTNGDTEIQVSEATAFTGTMNCSSQSITDLTGIEVFTNLTKLYCYNNQLTSLDMSQNTNLNGLYCHNNQLASLDLRNGNNLNISNAFFSAYNNPYLACIEVDDSTYATTNWTSIDPGTKFKTDCTIPINAPIVTIPDANFKAYLVGDVFINTNGDTEIQVSEANAFAGIINCGNRNIADLTGIEAFTSLTYLYCHSNQLTSLDVSQNISLISLSCHENQLTSLDLSQNINLWYLNCPWNDLTRLNVKNGANTNIISFDARNNPYLTCIEVDDVIYSTSSWTYIDAIASFSTNCNFLSTTNTINKNSNSTVYPNPATKDITIKLSKLYDEANIQVRNIAGQIVLSQKLENVSTTTLALKGAAGLYFITIQTEEGQEVLKVVKK